MQDEVLLVPLAFDKSPAFQRRRSVASRRYIIQQNTSIESVCLSVCCVEGLKCPSLPATSTPLDLDSSSSSRPQGSDIAPLGVVADQGSEGCGFTARQTITAWGTDEERRLTSHVTMKWCKTGLSLSIAQRQLGQLSDKSGGTGLLIWALS